MRLRPYNHDPDPLVLLGRVHEPGRTVIFAPAAIELRLARPGTFTSSELRLIEANAFEWVAGDVSWRIVFTRINPP